MVQDLPQKVMEFWEKGQRALEQGEKDEAMGWFLGYYDLLTVFLPSFNLDISEELIRTRRSEVEKEIKTLFEDDEYLKTSSIPPEGIVDIKAALGMTEAVKRPVYDRYELLDAPIFVKRPTGGFIEVNQVALVEYRSPSLREVWLELTCEGETKEFLYDEMRNDEMRNSQIPLQTIANEILASTGRDFSQFMLQDSRVVVQTTYPSLKNLLAHDLVEGGWLPQAEGDQIEVIGYPSTHDRLPDILGLEGLYKKEKTKIIRKDRNPQAKSPPFRPRRRR